MGKRNKDLTVRTIAIPLLLISPNKGAAAQVLANVGATACFGVLTFAVLAELEANVSKLI